MNSVGLLAVGWGFSVLISGVAPGWCAVVDCREVVMGGNGDDLITRIVHGDQRVVDRTRRMFYPRRTFASSFCISSLVTVNLAATASMFLRGCSAMTSAKLA